jgi:Lon protease-like protein
MRITPVDPKKRLPHQGRLAIDTALQNSGAGRLDLRIFERRYLDMVGECGRKGSGFGVCLILQGREAGEPALPAAVGTVAQITDFYTLPDGLLGIAAEGGARFQVTSTRVRDNGLVHGEVRFWPDEPRVPEALRSSTAPAVARDGVFHTTTPLRSSLTFAPWPVAQASPRTW